MVYEDKNAKKVLHIYRHYFIILLMLTSLYQIYFTGLFSVFEHFKVDLGRFV